MGNIKDKSEYIDLEAIIRVCRQKWYIFVICVVCCLGLGIFYIRTHNAQYLVKANMLITTDSSDGGGGALSSLSTLFGSSANVDDELYSVSSHSVLRDVAKQLGINKIHLTKTGFLQKRFDFEGYPVDVVCNPAIADTLRSSIVFTVKVGEDGLADVKMKALNQTLADVKNAKFPVEIKSPLGDYTVVTTPDYVPGEDLKSTIFFSGYDKAAEDLAESVKIDIASRKANVIEMEMESENIDYSRAVLNAVIDQYNLRGVAQDNLRHQKTLDFLNKRLELLTSDLSDVEGDLESMKSRQGIVDIYAEVQYQFAKKGEVESELVTAETQQEILKLIRDFLSDSANATSLVPNSLVNQSQADASGQAINSYNELLLQRMRIAQTASPGNAALKTIDEQLEAMRGNLLTTLGKSIESSQVAINELRSKFGSAQSALGQIPNQERVMRDILRQREIKEHLYKFLLQEREQVAMLLANANEKGRVIDSAYALNDEVSMSTKMILAVAFIMGVLLAFFIIYLQSMLRTKFSTRDELEGLLNAPILGEICLNRSGEAVVVKEKGSSSTAELFRLVRSNLLFMLNNPTDKVVLMTSTKSGEGKSFISINLASSLAMMGKKVLLIGLDIRNPRLAEYLQMAPTPGFTDYIAGGQGSVDRIIRKNAFMPGLDIIFAGPVPPNPSELLISPRVDEFFKEIRGMYDYIIVDSAPVGMVSDTLSLVRVSDATVYVCRANYTTKNDLRFFMDLYDNKRLPKVGLVLNGTTAKKAYGYGYGAKSE